MAGTRSNDTSWPQQPYNKVIDDDPGIIRVPLETVDYGARKGLLGRELEHKNNMDVKHIPSEK